MNLAIVEKIAKAVLYEGYLLYPYRPSAIKNRQRWNFGVLYPRSYSQAQAGSDRSMIETECLVEGNDRPVLEVRVRFLQLVERLVGQLISPVSQLLPGELPDFQLVERFEVNGKVFHPWQEAVEREISLPGRSLASLSLEPLVEPFALSSGKHVEPLRDSTGQTVGIIIRDQQPIRGVILLSARQVGDKLSRTTQT